MRSVALLDGDVHGGAAGVSDTAFYTEIDRYLARTSPPPEARAAVDFLRALSGWDYAAAVRASQPLVAKAVIGDLWLDPDLIRDGTTTAYMMQGDIARARAVYVMLAPFSRRSPTDLRTMLLEAYVRAARDSAKDP